MFSVSAFAATPESYSYARPTTKKVESRGPTRAATPTSNFNRFENVGSEIPTVRQIPREKTPLNCGGFYRGKFAIKECTTKRGTNGSDSLFCSAGYRNPPPDGILETISRWGSNDVTHFNFEVSDVSAKAFLCMKNKERGKDKNAGANVKDFVISQGMHLCDATGQLYNDPKNSNPAVKLGHFQRVAGLMSSDAVKVQAEAYLAAKGGGKSPEELLASCMSNSLPPAAPGKVPVEPQAPAERLPIPEGGPNQYNKPEPRPAQPAPAAPPKVPRMELPAPLPLPQNGQQ